MSLSSQLLTFFMVSLYLVMTDKQHLAKILWATIGIIGNVIFFLYWAIQFIIVYKEKVKFNLKGLSESIFFAKLEKQINFFKKLKKNIKK